MTDDGFGTPQAFLRHKESLKPPTWEEVPVEVPLSDVGFVERWYRNTSTGEVWRLVEPDYPFLGVWERMR